MHCLQEKLSRAVSAQALTMLQLGALYWLLTFPVTTFPPGFWTFTTREQWAGQISMCPCVG